MNTSKKILGLLAWVVLCLGVGGISSIFTFPAINGWYSTLIKPSFNPPDWVFGPVWTLLYILMGLAAYLVWVKGYKEKCAKDALYMFVIQLILNFTWSYAFFKLQEPWWAFINIIALFIAIGITIWSFKCTSRMASYLMIPYLLWVTFAGILNLAIAVLNK